MNFAIVFHEIDKPVSQIRHDASHRAKYRLIEMAAIVDTNVNCVAAQNFSQIISALDKLIEFVHLRRIRGKRSPVQQVLPVALEMAGVDIEAKDTGVGKQVAPDRKPVSPEDTEFGNDEPFVEIKRLQIPGIIFGVSMKQHTVAAAHPVR
ncbi:MAG: hypothetical protein F4050_15035, partial [Rhodospirillaceae bacterium]|nr:hypothetical protein [Rhodospirillaceae bacterium]